MSEADSRQLICTTFNPESDGTTITISGRIRLFAFSSVGISGGSNVLNFKNGDRSGDVILPILTQSNDNWGGYINLFRFSPSGILFPDGLFLDVVNTNYATNASFFYQGGG
tara:strand:- start:982 stop:1314 length:333 start_codon:yes stop_codon:yes gene_type:complete